MTTFIGLLRGINVGGRRKVAMAEVRAMLTNLGFTSVRSLLQSGNLVFDGRGDPSAIEEQLEEEASSRLELNTDFFVRTSEEWHSIIKRNPFADAASADPAHLLVMCLKDAPQPAQAKKLREAIRGTESVRVAGRNAYLVYPDGIGTSRLTGAVIERTLGTRGSARNWNTVLKLAALTGA